MAPSFEHRTTFGMQPGGLSHANTKSPITEKGDILDVYYPTYRNQQSGRPNPVAPQSIVRGSSQEGNYKTGKAVVRRFWHK